MSTAFANLSKFQCEQLWQLILRITKVVQPEKIICYGCRVRITHNWGCFLDDEQKKDRSTVIFHLLIICPNEEKRAFHEIMQIAEQQGSLCMSVSCVVHKLTSVNEALHADSHFFSTVASRGVMLFNTKGTPLQPPGDPMAINFSAVKAEVSWNRWFGMAKRFHCLANHSVASGWPDQAIFLLHQAVEHTCIALIRVFTGYRSNTHNLSRLLTMTENFSPILTSIFPRLTKEETALFNILLNGYSEPRYKDEYFVAPETIATLIYRVEQLQVVAEKLYQARIEKEHQKVSVSFPIMADGIPTP